MTDRADCTTQEGMIGKALRWWVSELAGMIPRGRSQKTGPALPVVAVDGPIVTIHAAGGSRADAVTLSLETDPAQAFTKAAARLSRRMSDGLYDVMLVVPVRTTLSTPITLPRAAEEDLADVVALSLGTETPYPAEEAHYDWKVDERTADTLTVTLISAQRSRIDAAIEALAPKGLGVKAVDVRMVGGRLLGVNLIARRAAEAVPPRRRSRWLEVSLAVVALGLAGFAIWQPITAHTRLVAETAARADRLRADASRTTATLDQIDSMKVEFGQLANAVSTHRTAISILDTVTRTLPDGTWLVELTIDGTQVRLRGYSDAAASLIGVLDAAPEFEDVAFKAPTTRSAVSDVEQFDIGLTVTPGDGS